MADPDATLRGILERNVATTGAGTAHHLNHVTIELDASEVGALSKGLEGLPVSVEGHFEAREHPDSGTRWVFKAHALREDVPVDDLPNRQMLRLAHRRGGARPQMKTSSRKRGTSIPTHWQEAKTRHHRRGRNQGGRSHPTPRERKTLPPGREMLHRVLASNRPGRTLAAEGVLFAMQESLFPILGSVATAAGSTRSYCSCGEGGDEYRRPATTLSPVLR